MQRTILVLFAVLSVISFNAYAAVQARSGKANRIEDRVIIQRRRIVLIRSPELARQFPERRSAVVIYPVISGLNDAVVLRRVRSALAFKKIFDYSLKEYREDPWLSEFS